MRFINLILVTVLLGCVSTFAQTTNLTYQGRLTDNTSPANGTYQMRFSLFNAPAGGTQDGSTIELTSVQVTNGVFTVELDFGSNPFPFGENRFLQIEVRRNAGEVYTLLTPRQQVTASPYSIRTLIANAAENSFRLGNVNASQYVQTTDSRLSDARPPTAGSGNYIQNRTTTQTSANFDISGTGEANILTAKTQFNLNNSRVLSFPGTNNTFVGVGTGLNISSGARNTFVGRDAGINTTTGSTNTFVGSGAGVDNQTGSSNSFFGFNSGLRNTSGGQNSIFGVSAGSGNLTGNQNSFFGYEAGLLATGNENSFFGANAGRSTTSGSRNSFFGRSSGESNTTGFSNVFVGESSGRNNTTGDNNSFTGNLSGLNNTTGNNNSYFGYRAGNDNQISSDNSLFGYQSGLNNVGGNNSFFGASAGRANTSGSNNVIFGADSGLTLTTGSNNTIIGTGADVSIDDRFFATAIGAGAVVTQDNMVQLGRDGLDSVRPGHLPNAPQTLCVFQLSNTLGRCVSSIKYKKDITNFRQGVNLLNKLRPVTFRWKDTEILDVGLVAEEVAEVEPLLTTTDRDGEIQGVKYDRLGVLLINVVKEQQAQIETRAEENKQLKTKIETLETELDEQKRQLESLRLLVCADKPEAEICQAEKEEKNDEK